MNTKTLDALKVSIAHWFELGSNQCALCGLFANNDCNECPVKDKTKILGCIGTPYGAVQRTWTGGGPALVKSCEAEVKFLQSLLPPGTLP